MKVAVLRGPGDLRIEEWSRPAVGESEALLKVGAVGISPADLGAFRAGSGAPLVPGREVAGEIAAVGPRVMSARPGDRVFVHHRAPCFDCERCRRGDYVQCRHWGGTRLDPGGFAEYLRVPAMHLENDTIPLRDTLSFEDGALVGPLAVVVKGIRRARVRLGDTALVLGLDLTGQLYLRMLRRAGAQRIIGVDRSAFRRGFALEHGADEALDPGLPGGAGLRGAVMDLTGGEGAQIVVINLPDAGAMAEGIGCAGPGAVVVFAGPARPGQRLRLDPSALHRRDLAIVGSHGAGPADTADAMEIVEAGTVRAEGLVTHRCPLERAAEAFRMAADEDHAMMVIVTP